MRPVGSAAITTGLLLGGAAAMLALALDDAPAPAAPRRTGRIDVTTATLAEFSAGTRLRVRGEVRTRYDGARYDAERRVDDDGKVSLSGAGIDQAGWLFVESAGWRLDRAAGSAPRGQTTLVASGSEGTVCTALGLASPCLVPRLEPLARERLLTTAEFASTLSGSLHFEEEPRLPASPFFRASLAFWTLAGLLASVAMGATLLRFVKQRRGRPIARIVRAAAGARRTVRGTPNEHALCTQIDSLLSHARVLVEAEARVTQHLEERGASVVNPPDARSDDRRRFGARVASELERLRGERERARHGLAEIEAALAVVALKAIEVDSAADRGAVALVHLERELSITEEAVAEAAAALG